MWQQFGIACERHRYYASSSCKGCPTSLLTPPAGEDIAKETAKEWKGLRVTVKLTVQNRVAKVGTAVCVYTVCAGHDSQQPWPPHSVQRSAALYMHHMAHSNRSGSSTKPNLPGGGS
jgi:hypothetical protein